MINLQTYLLLDGARLGGHLEIALQLQPDHVALYMHTEDGDVCEAGPYLCSFEENSNFHAFFAQEGAGQSWGFRIKSTGSLSSLSTHFRRFLKVTTDSGQSLHFRFYDPRVLRLFLPTCTPAQLIEFFGPVSYFLAEAKEKGLEHLFRHQQGRLFTENLTSKPVPPYEKIILLQDQENGNQSVSEPKGKEQKLAVDNVDKKAYIADEVVVEVTEKNITISEPKTRANEQKQVNAPPKKPTAASKWNTFD